jgi:hypothetical protein
MRELRNGIGSRSLMLLTTSVVIVLAACEWQPVSIHSPRFARSGPPLTDAARRVGSGHLAQLVPSFAGAVVDPPGGRTLVVYLTDMTAAAAAKSVIEGELHRRGRPELSAVFHQATYTYNQLEAWRDSLMLGPRAGVIRGEIDERNNVVRIGVGREAARTTVLQAAARLNIPQAAINLFAAQPAVPLTTLHSTQRPMKAGILIETEFDEVNGGQEQEYAPSCTYGPTVLMGSTSYFVTNGHCVTSYGYGYDTYGGKIGAAVWQRDTISKNPTNYVGSVVYNPPLTSCTIGGKQYVCRYSDAALVQLLDSGSSADTTTQRGYIAQPVSRAILPADSGSDSLQTTSIQLSGLMQDVFMGDTIEKVGFHTGWTVGVVLNTDVIQCDTTYYTHIAECRLQNVEVNAGGGPGDSGSPTFWKTSTGVYELAGILWGGNPGPASVKDTFYYSLWQNVNAELAVPQGWDFYFLAGSPPSISAGISGPTQIGISEACQWQGIVAGGTSPYTFTWSVYGQGDQNPVQQDGGNTSGSDVLSYQASYVDSSMTVSLTVTDAYNSSSTTSLGVDPSWYNCGS